MTDRRNRTGDALPSNVRKVRAQNGLAEHVLLGFHGLRLGDVQLREVELLIVGGAEERVTLVKPAYARTYIGVRALTCVPRVSVC